MFKKMPEEAAADPGWEGSLENYAEFMKLDGAVEKLDRCYIQLQALKRTTSDRLHVLCLASNQGKAEAVRAGVQAALALNRFDVVVFSMLILPHRIRDGSVDRGFR